MLCFSLCLLFPPVTFSLFLAHCSSVCFSVGAIYLVWPCHRIYEIDGKKEQFKRFIRSTAPSVLRLWDVFCRFYCRNIFPHFFDMMVLKCAAKNHLFTATHPRGWKSFYRFERLLSQLGPPIVYWIAHHDRRFLISSPNSIVISHNSILE